MVIDSISHRIFEYIKINDLDSIKSISDNGDYLRAINDLDYPGYSPLDLAVEFGFTNIGSYLIQQGADVNFSNISSPLHFAVCSGNTEIAKYLLDAGADSEFEIDDGRTPLMGAICSDSFDMVLLLVESGANILAEDRNGCSILHLAWERVTSLRGK
ncbi:ankyrin repeat domain-containing protein [Acaryochloris sp. CCMEE 5410]|uniref:ankyrin repeat domain-containing protein n=1 Tax=Acaryochloris sp. CCMEE 5410 TaxID=310037 RepID=UPI0002483D88|nr:ankyrin repeat domain-containing protein [Acaryochloris sp. CCMEE 5410]KAI9134757.1 ankyrin repeat domain-containing protein [Acaryochloris sp. CCMEE 5410]